MAQGGGMSGAAARAELLRRDQGGAGPGGATTQDPSTFSSGTQYAMDHANQERYAGADPNEQRAYDMASQGTSTADLDRARELTEKGAGTFLDANVDAYMNPYIKGALDPAARELRQQVGMDVRDAQSKAANAGAFGGSRGALLETEAKRGGTQAIGDLYAKGYQSAFESASNRFDADRNAAARGAEQYRALSSQGQAQKMQDMNALLTTGGLMRGLKQQNLDFNYDQFTQARDWDVNNLKPLLATLASVPHGETATTSTKSGGLGEVAGLAIAALGAFMGGGSGTAASDVEAGPSALSGGGGGNAGGSGTDGSFGNLKADPGMFGAQLQIQPTFQSAMP